MASYLNYYQQQARSGVGTVYAPRQRGHGIGNFFGNIFRTVVPYLKSGFNAIKDELFKGGIGLLSDVVKQVPAKESLSNRVRTFGDNLTQRAVNKVATSMSGSGAIRKRKATVKRQSASKRRRVKKSTKPKRKPGTKKGKKKISRKRKPKSQKKTKPVSRKRDIFD
jgi:hypothetical protein